MYPDALVNANHARINTLALGARLPTIHPSATILGQEVSCLMAQSARTCSASPIM
jgi:hypothetical protein